jgi:hypothetical protein
VKIGLLRRGTLLFVGRFILVCTHLCSGLLFGINRFRVGMDFLLQRLRAASESSRNFEGRKKAMDDGSLEE